MVASYCISKVFVFILIQYPNKLSKEDNDQNEFFEVLCITIATPNCPAFPLLFIPTLCELDLVNEQFSGSNIKCVTTSTSFIFIFIIGWYIMFWGLFYPRLVSIKDKIKLRKEEEKKEKKRKFKEENLNMYGDKKKFREEGFNPYSIEEEEEDQNTNSIDGDKNIVGDQTKTNNDDKSDSRRIDPMGIEMVNGSHQNESNKEKEELIVSENLLFEGENKDERQEKSEKKMMNGNIQDHDERDERDDGGDDGGDDERIDDNTSSFSYNIYRSTTYPMPLSPLNFDEDDESEKDVALQQIDSSLPFDDENEKNKNNEDLFDSQFFPPQNNNQKMPKQPREASSFEIIRTVSSSSHTQRKGRRERTGRFQLKKSASSQLSQFFENIIQSKQFLNVERVIRDPNIIAVGLFFFEFGIWVILYIFGLKD